jgi:coenzyme F420-reducing hydrogenase beta subunit
MEIEKHSLTSPEKCTGCAACMNICMTNAITMIPDNEGFLRPNIDKDKCIDCNKCSDICPVLVNIPETKNNDEPECYAAYSRDEKVRFESTSGGVFTHLASCVLRQNGAVVGARYKKDHMVEHAIIYCEDEIPELRQSKYVQSETGLVFRETERLLKDKRKVLFVGTPCQCMGLKSYLRKEYADLYICDFICRGANSPKVYKNYLSDLEKKYDSKIKQVWFKNKTISWNNFGTKIIFENGEEYFADRETDPYMLGYIKSNQSKNMRPCCYECKFKGDSRPWADITLGDFWGVENQFKDMDTRLGVSFVLANSRRGKSLLDKIKELCEIRPANIDMAIGFNKCLVQSVNR